MVNTRNIGIFQIPVDMVKRETELVAEMFSQLKIIPVRCETLFVKDCIQYTAISENFAELDEGVSTPEYHFIATKAEDGNYTFKAEIITRHDDKGIVFDLVNQKGEVIAQYYDTEGE